MRQAQVCASRILLALCAAVACALIGSQAHGGQDSSVMIPTARAFLGLAPAPAKDAQEAIERCPRPYLDVNVGPLEKKVEAAASVAKKSGYPGSNLQTKDQRRLVNEIEGIKAQTALLQDDYRKLADVKQRWRAEREQLDKRLGVLQEQYDEHDPCAKSADRGCGKAVSEAWHQKIVDAINAYLQATGADYGEAEGISHHMLAELDEHDPRAYRLVRDLLSMSDACDASSHVQFLKTTAGKNSHR